MKLVIDECKLLSLFLDIDTLYGSKKKKTKIKTYQASYGKKNVITDHLHRVCIGYLIPACVGQK